MRRSTKLGLYAIGAIQAFKKRVFLSDEDVDGPLLCVLVVRTGVLFTVPILGVSMTENPKQVV